MALGVQVFKHTIPTFPFVVFPRIKDYLKQNNLVFYKNMF
jgi:hypothetical protein